MPTKAKHAFIPRKSDHVRSYLEPASTVIREYNKRNKTSLPVFVAHGNQKERVSTADVLKGHTRIAKYMKGLISANPEKFIETLKLCLDSKKTGYSRTLLDLKLQCVLMPCSSCDRLEDVMELKKSNDMMCEICCRKRPPVSSVDLHLENIEQPDTNVIQNQLIADVSTLNLAPQNENVCSYHIPVHVRDDPLDLNFIPPDMYQYFENRNNQQWLDINDPWLLDPKLLAEDTFSDIDNRVI